MSQQPQAPERRNSDPEAAAPAHENDDDVSPRNAAPAEDEERKMVEGWKDDAEGLLVFAGLFSAAVAALLTVTLPDIRPSSQDASAYYLAQIYQQQVFQSNGSRISILSSLVDPSQPFTPPTAALWVNRLWFLSLVMGLTSALLATLLQQWVRRYLILAHRRYQPRHQARLYAVIVNVPRIVEVLLMLLHVSLGLFLAGLSVFLFGVNHHIFNVVITWLGLCVGAYAYLTFLPFMYMDSPYSTPLSVLLFSIRIRILKSFC